MIRAFPDQVPADKRTFTNVVPLPATTACSGGGGASFYNQAMVPPGYGMRLIGPGPYERLGGWLVLGEPGWGDVGLLTLDGDRFKPRQFHKVALAQGTDGHPSLGWASVASVTMERGQVGLDPGQGEVLFALGGIDAAGNPSQTLWVGGFAGTVSQWRPLAGSPVSGTSWLERSTVVVEPKAGRVVVLAEVGEVPGDVTTDPGPLLAHHPVYALDLAQLTWSALGTLDLPADLGGYTVVHDPLRRRLLVVGGRVETGESTTVYQVSLQDLAVAPLVTDLPAGTGRHHAAAALAPDGRTLLVFGGERGDVPVTDLWSIDTIGRHRHRD